MRSRSSCRSMNLAAVGLAVVLLAAAGLPAQEQRLVNVIVRNLPEVQEVSGTVTIDEVAPHATMVRFSDLVVSPAPRDTNRLLHVGTLSSEGFTSVVLSLAGEIKGSAPESATLGVLLIPDEKIVVEAFESGQILLPIELNATIKADASAYIAAAGTPVPVAFPRYRVYLYNTCKRTIRVELFAYLRT